jgi:hypothetical protein
MRQLPSSKVQEWLHLLVMESTTYYCFYFGFGEEEEKVTADGYVRLVNITLSMKCNFLFCEPRAE